MAQMKLTTTGTQSPVVFADLGKRTFTHPTTNYDLLTEFKLSEIQESADVQSALTAGYITLTDENALPVTGTIAVQLATYSKIQIDTYLAAKQAMIGSPTNGHIVTTNGSGQTLDSAKAFNDSGTTTSDVFTAAGVISKINSSISGLSGWMKYLGTTDASGNPNYPAANQGEVYIFSVAGKIGGASGPNVEVGDMIICKTTTISGSHAGVGANWDIIQTNIDGAAILNTAVTFSDITDSGLTASQIVETDSSKKLISAAKGTAYNKNFTVTASDIKINGTQAVGSLTTIAPADHVHPTDSLINFSAARNSVSVTNTYLYGENSFATNVSPYIVPCNATIIGISASTSASSTWTAEVHVNGTLLSGTTLSLSAVLKNKRFDLTGKDVVAGDEISLYCNGTSVNRPRMTVYIQKR